jgi:hypothetical protein
MEILSAGTSAVHPSVPVTAIGVPAQVPLELATSWLAWLLQIATRVCPWYDAGAHCIALRWGFADCEPWALTGEAIYTYALVACSLALLWLKTHPRFAHPDDPSVCQLNCSRRVVHAETPVDPGSLQRQEWVRLSALKDE